MFTKEITAFGRKMQIACDGKCEKAFGINGRPKVQLSDDIDDYYWLSDDEVGLAPESGKTVIIEEGYDRKPSSVTSTASLNKWCFRECERCVSANLGKSIKLNDFSQRVFNIKQR